MSKDADRATLLIDTERHGGTTRSNHYETMLPSEPTRQITVVIPYAGVSLSRSVGCTSVVQERPLAAARLRPTLTAAATIYGRSMLTG